MNLLVAGGGSGGHLYPALALIEGLRAHLPIERVGYVGTRRGLEARVLPGESQIEFFPIHARGFARRLSWSNLRALLALGGGLAESLMLLRRFRPDLIIGTGGYASFAPLACGIALGLPTVIHEPNARPGLVNRLLAPWAGLTTVAWSQATAALRPRRWALTGTPLRRQISQAGPGQVTGLRLDPSRPLLLVIGGSHGAQVLNDQILHYADYFSQMEVVLITGREGYRCARRQLDVELKNIHLLAYADRMGPLLAVAQLVICRAGAVTLAELTALGKPALLVPWPGAAGGHQEANARALAGVGAARWISEDELLPGPSLARAATELLADPARLAQMADASARLGQPDALDKVIREVERYLYEADHRSVSLHRHRRGRHERAGPGAPRARLPGQRFQPGGEPPGAGAAALGHSGLLGP